MQLTANPTKGDIAGTVRTAGTLLPAEGAVITYYALNVKDLDPGDFVDDYTVNDDGTYQFIGLEPGSYTVVIRHPGKHETLIATQSIAAGDDIAKNYLLQVGGSAEIIVALTDEDNDPVSGASVELEDANGDTVTSTSGVDGKVNFTDLSAGTYTMTITYGGYLPVEVPVTVAKGATVNRAFKLTPLGDTYAITVGVTGFDHAPLAGAKVVAFDADGKPVNTTIAATDASGTTSFSVVNGTYTVGIYLDGYLYEERTVTVKDAAVNLPVVILTVWDD